VRLPSAFPPSARSLTLFFSVSLFSPFSSTDVLRRVLVTASIVATNVTDETAAALDAQIKRHLDGASYEIAAATTKRFKVVEASLIDPLAYALRDAVAADRPLVAGGTGYTLPVSPTLLAWNYDTQATSDLSPGMATFPEGRGLGEACVSASANTQCACTVGTHAETCSSCQRTAGSGACTKVGGSVDLTTSSVYYSDGTTNPSVSPPTLSKFTSNLPPLIRDSQSFF